MDGASKEREEVGIFRLQKVSHSNGSAISTGPISCSQKESNQKTNLLFTDTTSMNQKWLLTISSESDIKNRTVQRFC